MSTIPTAEPDSPIEPTELRARRLNDAAYVEHAHQVALNLVRMINQANQHSEPGALPAKYWSLVGYGLAENGEIDGHETWWITSSGAALLTVQVDPAPPTTRVDDVEEAHAEAVDLKRKLRRLYSEHPGDKDLGELIVAGLAAIDPVALRWWITEDGLRLLGIDPAGPLPIDPDGYQVTWRLNGVLHHSPRENLEGARACVDALIAQLRAGKQVSRVTLFDSAGRNVTEDAARGLIPHTAELRRLATRAKFIDGLRELTDYLASHPNVPTPGFPPMLHAYVTADSDDAGRDAIYVAAAALDIQPQVTNRGAHVASRIFGSVHYEVVFTPHLPEPAPVPVAPVDEPTGPLPEFSPTGQLAWTADANGGVGA